MANTAFWLGAMKGMHMTYPDIRDFMSFADVRDNFGKSARFGIDTKFTWTKDQKVTVKDLMLEELIPMARNGLKTMEVDQDCIDRYMNVITERMKAHMNGARWMLRSFTKLKEETSTVDEALTYLTASIHSHQNQEDLPIHRWEEADTSQRLNFNVNELRVSQLMQIDIFSAQPKDLVELVAKLMSWKNINYMPVEDQHGHLVGLISVGILIDSLVLERKKKNPKDLLVKDVMIKDPVTVGPKATLAEVERLMTDLEATCLPVIKKKELVGIVTMGDVTRVKNRMSLGN